MTPTPQRHQPLDRFLGVVEVAELLGQPQSTVYKWCRNGYPDYPRSAKLRNGRVITRLSDLEAWLDEAVR